MAEKTFTDMSRLIATTMSSSLEKLVPLLEGSNYLIWAGAMRPYLQSQGTWRIVSGNEPKPRTLTATATNATEVATSEEIGTTRMIKHSEQSCFELLHPLSS